MYVQLFKERFSFTNDFPFFAQQGKETLLEPDERVIYTIIENQGPEVRSSGLGCKRQGCGSGCLGRICILENVGSGSIPNIHIQNYSEIKPFFKYLLTKITVHGEMWVLKEKVKG